MTRTSLLCVVALVLLEACAVSSPRQPTLTAEQLLAGDALPWDPSSVPPLVGEDEAFGLDDEMRAFVAPLTEIPDPAARLVRLRNAMLDGGLFSVEYADTFTRTASATFHERQGNCLSFTMLFVALARAVGLEVRYHVVDVPPTFNNDLGVVVVGTHVNAVIDASADRRFVVDFNAPNFREGYPSRAVSDRYAVALFYSNLGAEALSRRQYELSFASLRAALRSYDMPAIWVNLGVLYARQGLYEHAEAAQLHALEADPGEQSALVNLVSVYSALGEKALADEYRQRIRRYREINPYYHFAVAQMAYDAKRFRDALRAVRSAIRLKEDEDEFYSLEGRALTELGRPDRAAGSFARAKELAAPRS